MRLLQESLTSLRLRTESIRTILLLLEPEGDYFYSTGISESNNQSSEDIVQDWKRQKMGLFYSSRMRVMLKHGYATFKTVDIPLDCPLKGVYEESGIHTSIAKSLYTNMGNTFYLSICFPDRHLVSSSVLREGIRKMDNLFLSLLPIVQKEYQM